MTLVTLRPNATTISSGVVVTGAATVHAALNDSSDSSYVASIGDADSFQVGWDDLTLPAGAVIKTATLRARANLVSAGTNYLGVGSDQGLAYIYSAGFTVNWTTPATFTVGSGSAPMTDGQVDGEKTSLGNANPTYPDIQVFALYLDITYVTQPVTAPSAPTGTITTTNLPAVTWANTLDSDGGAQTAYQI
jgi:hypothetical protein